MCRGTGTAPKRVACQNGKERTAGILGKGEDIDGRKIIYDGGRSGNRIKGIKVQSLSVPDGSMLLGVPAKVRRPLTEEEIESNRRAAEEYIHSMKTLD